MTTPSRSKFRAFCLWSCISLHWPKFDLMPYLLIFTAKNSPRTSLETSHLLKKLGSKVLILKTCLERFQLEESQDDSCWCKPSLRLQEENQHEQKRKQHRLLGESRGGKEFFETSEIGGISHFFTKHAQKQLKIFRNKQVLILFPCVLIPRTVQQMVSW